MHAALSRFRHPLELGVFAQVPAIAFLWLVWFAYGHGGGGDFAIFRRAGSAVLVRVRAVRGERGRATAVARPPGRPSRPASATARAARAAQAR